MSDRLFYAAGPGNVIRAHEQWKVGQHDPTEVSITFSSQFEEYCRLTGSSAYMVSSNSQRSVISDGSTTLEHRPKPMPKSSGMRYHIAQIIYGLSLFRTALKFKANVALIDSGTSHYFVGALYWLAGIPVVTILHNTIWPAGFPPVRPVPRLINRLDSIFFRWMSSATIGVSPECIRQVSQITSGRHKQVYQIRAQFLPDYFKDIDPPPAHSSRPFRIMYIGRVNRIKGVFDILEMASKIEASAPGRVKWELCGSGPDLELLRQRHHEMGLADCVSIVGWVSLEKLRDVYARSHLSIVPTRSDFAEGLAMTAAEAILFGRPVLTSPVVPALELLQPACIEAMTNDVDSYVEAILRLIDDPVHYESLCQACPGLQAQFYDRRLGLTSVLKEVLQTVEVGTHSPPARTSG